MQQYVLKSGDSLPALYATLLDAKREPVPLIDVSNVYFSLRKQGASGLVIDHGACVVTSAVGARVRYDWDPAVVLTPGVYLGEFRAVWGTRTETFPNEGFVVIRVLPNVSQVS